LSEDPIDIYNEFIIFPNPTSGKINILCPENSSQKIKYSLFGPSGQKLVEEYGNELDISNMQPGLYLLLIENDSYKSINKIT
jgi:hypothetical protein